MLPEAASLLLLPKREARLAARVRVRFEGGEVGRLGGAVDALPDEAVTVTGLALPPGELREDVEVPVGGA